MGCLNSKSTDKAIVVSKKTNSIDIKFDKDLSSEQEAGRANNGSPARSTVVGQDIVLVSANTIMQDNTMAVDQTDKHHESMGIDTGSSRKKLERKQNGTFNIDDKPIKAANDYQLPRDSEELIASEGRSQAYSSQKSTFHATAQAKKLEKVIPPPSQAVTAVAPPKINSPRADLK